MKRWLAALTTALLLLALCPLAPAMGEGGSTLLRSLENNCPNTGIMLPSVFRPEQTTYLLTVASWVARPTFTPTAYDENAVITVNGQTVKSGKASQVIPMTDEPQTVTIVVSNGGASTTYTVYLQRRPSERRTRVSAGFLNSVYLKGTTWHIDADLVAIKYKGGDYASGNLSTYKNSAYDSYDNAVSPNCIFYYGTKQHCTRAANIEDFVKHSGEGGYAFYTLIYIEDQIVAVFPYEADY